MLVSHQATRVNSRYVNGKVSTYETFFDPILENYLEKEIPVLEKSRNDNIDLLWKTIGF